MNKRRLGRLDMSVELLEDLKSMHLYDMVFGKLTIENVITQYGSAKIGYVVSSPLLPICNGTIPALEIEVNKGVNVHNGETEFIYRYRIVMDGRTILRSEGILNVDM